MHSLTTLAGSLTGVNPELVIRAVNMHGVTDVGVVGPVLCRRWFVVLG